MAISQALTALTTTAAASRQQRHGLTPNARNTLRGSGASKSFRTRILPLSAPKPVRRDPRTIGTSRTMGFPALAMTMSSPLTASSTRRDRLVLAACRLTYFMN